MDTIARRGNEMELRRTIESDMRNARRARDRETDLVLRSVLQAFDNASAVDYDGRNRATYGLGGDVDRRLLSDADLQKVLRSLIDERILDMRTLRTHGQDAQADGLSREVDLIRRYLSPSLDPEESR